MGLPETTKQIETNRILSAEEVRDTIISVFHTPDKINSFGKDLLPDVEIPDIDPKASDKFQSALEVYLENLLATHPWARFYFGRPIHSSGVNVEFSIYAWLSKLTMNTSLTAHYKHIKALENLDSSKERLEASASKLQTIYDGLHFVKRQLDAEIDVLSKFLDTSYEMLKSDLTISSFSESQPTHYHLFVTRLSALSSRLIIAKHQALEIDMAENSVLVNLDRFSRLNDVFIPAYYQQLKLLEGASPSKLYRYYHKFRHSLQLQLTGS